MMLKALISQYMSGGIMVGCMACGYFFFRFWQKTGDSLFAVFAVSFWILAIERIFLLATVNVAALDEPHDLRGYVYLFRLTAFMLIIVAFLLKNRRPS